MDTVALVATVAYPYAGRSLAVGDVFQASQRDAELLTLLRRAVYAPPSEPSTEQPMPVKMRALMDFERSPTLTGARTQTLQPGDEFDAHDVESVALATYRKAELVSEEPAVEQPRKKRRYRRRDLRAEP